jgi:hypothetical protein
MAWWVSTYGERTSTATCGNFALMDRAASRPSLVWVGGIRMSVMYLARNVWAQRLSMEAGPLRDSHRRVLAVLAYLRPVSNA